jgi:8-oxo-dGTP pyrophosphatase MutT (NUDIX family)
MSDLPPTATPPSSAPRAASTVVVLRAGPRGPEVLMVRRNRGASFMADAYVFPGGRVDPEDGEPPLAFARAAVRELREEAALDVPVTALVEFARWITPSAEPKRFDAHFYLTTASADQVARHDTFETVDSLWATPREVLDRYERGELKLPPPTICNLEDLEPHATVEDALEWARRRPFTAILPKLVPEGDSLAIVLPWDPAYSQLPGEGMAIDPAHPLARGRSRFVLADGRWWGRKV